MPAPPPRTLADLLDEYRSAWTDWLALSGTSVRDDHRPLWDAARDRFNLANDAVVTRFRLPEGCEAARHGGVIYSVDPEWQAVRTVDESKIIDAADVELVVETEE